ncbi:MAG: hypothetical protein SEPTF4163_004295 [Sporothrix epigloea]
MSTATGPISAAPTPSGSTEVSNTRLYLGNLPRTVTKTDIENHFNKHGTGDILEIKLMNGFGFIEYKDAMDARDVVPAFHGSTFMGERLTVQFARGARATREGNSNTPQERPPPRPRRTGHRMGITGLPTDTSWQDLKDFARRSGMDVVYSETSRSGDGSVEFETAQDLATAIEKLNQTDHTPNFKIETVAGLGHLGGPTHLTEMTTTAVHRPHRAVASAPVEMGRVSEIITGTVVPAVITTTYQGILHRRAVQ